VIHASKTLPAKGWLDADIEEILNRWEEDAAYFETATKAEGDAALAAKRAWLTTASHKYAGCVLGYTELIATDTDHCSWWDVLGMKHLRLGAPHPLKAAPEWKGARGLWQVSDELKGLIEDNDIDAARDSEAPAQAPEEQEQSTDTEPEEPFDMRDGEITTSPSPAIELKAGDRVLYEERTLPVPLTEAEELDALHDVVRILKEVDALEYEKKTIAKELGAEIEKKKTELIAATRYADCGKNERLVRCLEVTQYADNMRSVVRLDTHRIVEQRQLLHEERQGEVQDIDDPSFLAEDSEEAGLTSLQIAAVEMSAFDKVLDIDSIGRNLDVDSDTMAAWMKDPAFIALLDKKCNEAEATKGAVEGPEDGAAAEAPVEDVMHTAEGLLTSLHTVDRLDLQSWLNTHEEADMLKDLETLSPEEMEEVHVWIEADRANPQDTLSPPEFLSLIFD